MFHFYLDIYVAYTNLSAALFHVIKKSPESNGLAIIMSCIIKLIHYAVYFGLKLHYFCSQVAFKFFESPCPRVTGITRRFKFYP